MKNYFPKMPKLVVVLFVAALLSLLLMDFAPPRAQTTGAMVVAKQRVLRHALRHDSLPASLGETQPIEGKVDGLVDGWGHALRLEVGPGDRITLRSYGKDDQPGGDGANADLIGIFAARDAQGNWSPEIGEWIAEPDVTRPSQPTGSGELGT